MIRSVRALTASAYLSMFFLGVSGSMIGAAARNIGLSPYEIGLMIAFQNVGFTLAVLVSGALADTWPKPPLLFAGSLVLGVALFAFYRSDLFWVNLALMLLIGVGIGVYEGVTDAMLIEMHSQRVSLHISVNHFFVTFGSIVITAYLIFLQMNWRQSVRQAAYAVLALALFFVLARLESGRRSAQTYASRLRSFSRDRVILALFLATAVAVGVESGTTGLLTTYLMDLRGFDQVTSKLGLVTFLGGVASGRLAAGVLARKERLAPSILALFGVSVITFAGLYTLELGAWIYAAIFLAGVAISATLPLVLALAGLLYEDLAGTVLGSLKVAIPLGGILLPFLVSLLSKYASFRLALLAFPLAFLLAFVVLVVTLGAGKSVLVAQENRARG